MKLANIIPVAHLNTLVDQRERFHLVIANLINEVQPYREFYRERVREGDYVIIDSLAFERPEGSSAEDLAQAWRTLWRPRANLEIVLPDRMDDPFESVRMTRQGLEELRSVVYADDPTRRTKFQAVPHGRTWEEYLAHAKELANLSDVSVIGVQEEVDDLFEMIREVVVYKLQATIGGKQWHLNGVREDLTDLRSEWMRKNVRSTDTSKFVVWGFNNVGVRPDMDVIPRYPGRKKFGGSTGYFAYAASRKEQLTTAYNNLVAWREYL